MLKIWLAFVFCKIQYFAPKYCTLRVSGVVSWGLTKSCPGTWLWPFINPSWIMKAFYNVHFSPPMLAPNVRASTCFRRCSYSDKDLMLPSWHRTAWLFILAIIAGSLQSRGRATLLWHWLHHSGLQRLLWNHSSLRSLSRYSKCIWNKSARLMLSVLFCLSSGNYCQVEQSNKPSTCKPLKMKIVSFPSIAAMKQVYLIFYPLTESQSCLRNNGKTNTVL